MKTYRCAKCGKTIQAVDQLHPTCCLTLAKRVFKSPEIFINPNDTAIQSHTTKRYRDWVNSPEVQAKLRSGELVIERTYGTMLSNPLSDYLNDIECRDLGQLPYEQEEERDDYSPGHELES